MHNHSNCTSIKQKQKVGTKRGKPAQPLTILPYIVSYVVAVCTAVSAGGAATTAGAASCGDAGAGKVVPPLASVDCTVVGRSLS